MKFVMNVVIAIGIGKIMIQETNVSGKNRYVTSFIKWRCKMGRLIDITDERFWKILFDEACVEGQQADRIEKELKKVSAYDVEAVVKKLEQLKLIRIEQCHEDYELEVMTKSILDDAIEIVRNDGVR